MDKKRLAPKAEELIKGLYINSEPKDGYTCFTRRRASRITNEAVTEIMEKVVRSRNYINAALN
jgi:hypothetical protein